ncbi:MAG: FeoC-like transcriptional regulator [Wenzhouxiangella sp.]|jgi:hypothetical protein|nr:FeoC-like transcriptional regulator [Wenzhouxiangella sp.]
MILSDIRDYLQTHRRAALADMSMHFRVEPDALRGMLQKWMTKGRVEKLPAGTPCSGGCCRCNPQSIEIYEWRG